MWGLDTVPASARWVIGEIRSTFDISFVTWYTFHGPVTFTDISAIMSDRGLSSKSTLPKEKQKNQTRGDVMTKHDHVNSETYTFGRYLKAEVGTTTNQNIMVKERGKKTLERQWI